MEAELEQGYLLAVAATAVWSPRPLVAMLRAFESARALVQFARAPLRAEPPPGERLGAETLVRIALIDDVAARTALAAAREAGQCFVTSTSLSYPRRLLELCDPPPVLYYRGDINVLKDRTVAVVGSRACTPYGWSTTAQFVRGFSTYGATVISGLARGIDAAAHRAAMTNGVPTVAVLGSGLRALYPPYHDSLAGEIVERGGAVVTEFPPHMAARQHHFPMRNRLVAALACATVVVEAGARSGALITARLAADLGRYVFAVPGDVGRTASEGSNALIKDGVTLTTGADDVAAILGWTPRLLQSAAGERPDAAANGPPGRASTVLAALAEGCSGVDELCLATNLDAATVSAQLTLLEMQGLIERGAGGLYRPT